MPWQPWLGAVPGRGGTSFRVWAPRTSSLEVKIVDGPTARLRADGEGYYAATLEGVRPGARYVYRFPDGRERPDPASLLQPEGVHGPSEVVDLAALAPRSRGVRRTRGARAPGRGGSRPGIVRLPRRRLQPLRTRGELPGRVRALPHLAPPHALGRRGELRRPRLGPGAAFRDRERLALGGERGRRIRRAAAGRRARHRGRFAGPYPDRAERRRAARGARDRTRDPRDRGERSERGAPGRASRPGRVRARGGLGGRLPPRAARRAHRRVVRVLRGLRAAGGRAARRAGLRAALG